MGALSECIQSGCGDDGFIDFRSNLISLGRKLYFQVLEDPDSLENIVGRNDTPYLQAEGFQYIPSRVFREVAGNEMPEGAPCGPAEPVGEQIDHDDDAVMRRYFPKIVAKFPEMGD